MFTEKLDNILKLVEYLHSNIDNFSQYNVNFEEIQNLDEVRAQLNPDNSFKEQKEKKDVEAKRKEQFQIVIKNVIEPIIKKLTELNISCGYEFDRFDKEANQNIDENDLQRLNECKKKFLEYRNTNFTPINLKSHKIEINELDQIFPEIISFFIGDENNEFDFLKPKPKPIKENPKTVECSEHHQNCTPTAKETPKTESRSIIFKDKGTIMKIYEILEIYFKDKENELLDVLNGKAITEKLHFPSNANKLVEFFGRVKYNKFISSSKVEITKWICFNFTYNNSTKKEVQNYNYNTTYSIISKRKGEATKNERIGVDNLFPFKGSDTLKSEKLREKIKN